MKLSYHYLMLLNHSIYQKKIYEKIEELNLTIGQPKIFDFLLECNGCIQKDIATGCQIEPASVTSILLNMEKKGFIERKKIGENRRSHYVFLTLEGEKIAKKVRAVMEEVEEEALKEFSIEEKEQFLNFLKKVNINLAGETFCKR